MDYQWTRLSPLEQVRWNDSNIDSMFHAGSQSFVNRHYGMGGNSSVRQHYFNIIQQPCNLVTGRQRQHRKSWVHQATEGGDDKTVDQYTKLTTHAANMGGIHEQFSKSCELACVAGLNLLQPYLDYTGSDPLQGELKLKIWEYNSFLVDPYARCPLFTDAQIIWCQEYITFDDATRRFGQTIDKLQTYASVAKRFGRFYFLPENYNMSTSGMLVLSYIWYKSTRKKERLYSKKNKQFYDFGANEEQVQELIDNIPDLRRVEQDVSTWKLCVVLNDQLMYHGLNPLKTDSVPVIPNYWNYDPHLNELDLRNRSMVRPMRSPQALFNFKVMNNNDIAAATINAGWKRKAGAVANEDNLKKAGQGWDVVVNTGFEMTDVEKILPSAVPESDLMLAQQMADLVEKVTGINMENWAGQEDKQISSLTMLLKQDSSLMIFQKYFDQWDRSFKALGTLILEILISNWEVEKVEMMIGEEPTPLFYNKIFAKFHTLVEEGDSTPTQRNLQAKQMLELNEIFFPYEQRMVFPASKIIPYMNITGKSDIIAYLEEQEKAAQESNQEQSALAHTIEDAKLKELYSKSVLNLASASERKGREESNIGLYEERLSETNKNEAGALKDKMEALLKMIEAAGMLGDLQMMVKVNQLDQIEQAQKNDKLEEKINGKMESIENDSQNSIMNISQMPTPMTQQSQGMAQQQPF